MPALNSTHSSSNTLPASVVVPVLRGTATPGQEYGRCLSSTAVKLSGLTCACVRGVAAGVRGGVVGSYVIKSAMPSHTSTLKEGPKVKCTVCLFFGPGTRCTFHKMSQNGFVY